MTGFSNVNTAKQNAPYSRGHKYGDTVEFNTLSKLQQAGDGARVNRVHVYHGTYVHGIEFEYLRSDGNGYRDGGWSTAAGSKHHQVIDLDHDEYISKLSGRSGSWIDTITIETNKGQTVRCGSSNGGSAFSYSAANGTGICAVRGGCGGHLHFIAPYYAKLATTPAPSSLLEPLLGVATANGIQGQRVRIPITVANRNPDDAKLSNIEISGVPEAYDIIVKTRNVKHAGFRTANKGKEHAPGHFAWNVSPSKLALVSLQPRSGINPAPTGMFSLAVVAKVTRGTESKSAMQMLQVFIKPDTKTLNVALNPTSPNYRYKTVKDDGYTVKSAKLGLNGAVVFKVNAPSNSAIALKLLGGEDLNSSKARFILNNRGNESVARKDPEGTGSKSNNDYDMLANCNNPGHGWREVPGRLRHISVNSMGRVWGTNRSDNIYIRNGTTAANTLGSGWTQVPASGFKLTTIGDGNQVWALGNNDKIFLRVGTSDTNPDGDSWKEIPGRLNWLSVGTLGQVWGVNNEDSIYRMPGISRDRPQGTEAWHKLDGKLNQISCHGKQVWGVNDNKKIYYRVGVSRSNPNGTTWQEVDGSGVKVEVASDGRIWLVTHLNELWYRQGVTDSNPGGLRWVKVCGDIKDVAVSGRCVWAIRASDEAILKRNHTERPTFWAQVDKEVARIGRGAKIGAEVLVEYSDPSFKDVTHFALYSSADEETKWDVSIPGKLAMGAQVINRSAGTPTRELEVVGTNFDLSYTGFVKLGGKVLHATRKSGHKDGGRGLNIVILNKADMTVNEMKQYNVYNSESNCNDMARYLGYFDERFIVCIYSYDAIKINSNLSAALKRCGASSAIDRITNWRHSYALIGIPGMGENTGREELKLNDKKTLVRVKANYTNGALTRSIPTELSAPVPDTANGAWNANTMIITGVPNDAMMSHGYALRADGNKTTTWTVPVSDDIDLHLLYDMSVIDEDELKAFNLSAAAGMSFDVNEKTRMTIAAGFGTQNKIGSFSDGCNQWIGAMTTTRAEVGASLVAKDGSKSLTIKGQMTATGGSEVSSGSGDEVKFGCWRCGGEGNLSSPSGARTCPECDGNGYTISPGARMHIYAGAKVEIAASAAYSTDLGNGATFNLEPKIEMKAGAFMEGDADLYSGEGIYGAQVGGEMQMGVDVDITIEGSVGSDDYRIGGSVGVSPPGSVGIGGGAVAKYDDGKITFGLSGELDFLVGGICGGFEFTIDTGPAQEFVATLYDDVSNAVSTAVVNGTAETIAWAEAAGHTVARGADGAVIWTEGAAADTAEFFEDTGEAIGGWTAGAANDVADWTTGAANDVADWTTTAAGDVGDWTETAASDVGSAVADTATSAYTAVTSCCWIMTGLMKKDLISKEQHEKTLQFSRWLMSSHPAEILLYWKVLKEPVKIAMKSKSLDWWKTHMEWADFCLEMISEDSDESLEAAYHAFLHKAVSFVEQFNPTLAGLAPYHQETYRKVKKVVFERGQCPSRGLSI